MNQQGSKKDNNSGQNTAESINLIGFNVLPPEDMDAARKIIGNHVRQLAEKTDYKSMKMMLRVHKKGESSLSEIAAQASIGNENFGAKIEGWNLYEVIGKVMETILTEAIKKKRNPKEINEGIIREEKKKERKQKI